MLSLDLLALTITLISTFYPAQCTPVDDSRNSRFSRLQPRNYVAANQISASYDYVIAGGGLAGLVLAARLSDDPTKSVLVLEAGPSGDAVASRINIPGNAYQEPIINAEPYDWLYKTVAQANASGRVMPLPRGRVLGGSSAVNGMFLVRPSRTEVTAWHDLIAPDDATAAQEWSWDSFFAAMKNTENFTAPVSESESVAGMQYTTASHGTNGRLHATYPGYMVPISNQWFPTLSNVGISKLADGYAGDHVGGMFALSAINPTNWTRSYSKSAYIDPLPPRSNLAIVSGATVERITFSNAAVNGSLIATGVQFSSGKGTSAQSVLANKEVLLSGGAMGSAHILLVSGVGPKDVLSAANVNVNLELPGVGQHFLDHLATAVSYSTTVDTQGSIYASGSNLSKTPEFNSFIDSAVAYVNGSLLFGGNDSFATFVNALSPADTYASTSWAASSKYSQVIEGYKTIYNTTVTKMYPSGALIEILLGIDAARSIAVQVALQQPLSQGSLIINSSSIYDKPVIDPQYLSHPADITILRQGIKLARLIARTPPLSGSLGAEITPGPTVQTDADIETWLRSFTGTEYHPSGACSMLPLAKGGVVDATLKVHGLANVRVVDSSIYPVLFSSHLSAPTYALAERAAAIILSSASNSPSSTASADKSTSTNGSGTKSALNNSAGLRSLLYPWKAVLSFSFATISLLAFAL